MFYYSRDLKKKSTPLYVLIYSANVFINLVNCGTLSVRVQHTHTCIHSPSMQIKNNISRITVLAQTPTAFSIFMNYDGS